MPFAGLSYTTFNYSPHATTSEVSLAPVRAMLAATYTAGRTFPSSSYEHELAGTAPLVSYFVNGKPDHPPHTLPAVQLP